MTTVRSQASADSDSPHLALSTSASRRFALMSSVKIAAADPVDCLLIHPPFLSNYIELCNSRSDDRQDINK